MVHNYPYTDFHELNLDYILKLARSSMGLHLEQADKFLKLVNAQGEEISKLQIYYAQTALQDDIGNNIDAYIIRSAVSGDNLVFTRGNGEAVTITVPYAVKAAKDIRNNDILSYIKNISVTGTDLIITNGNNDSYSITVPYAVKAKEDINGKDITTYVADITTGNDKLIVKDSTGNIIREITVPYAVKAKEDINGEDIAATYGAALTADVTTISLRSKDNTILSTITVPYAVKALSDTQGNEFLSDYGYNLAVDGNKVALEAHDGSMLNEITVPFAVLATDATNAIESVQISGDEVVFTTYGGQATRITVPYAVKALKDNLNNTLSHTYIANAVNDPVTGKITFYAQDGSIIAEMIPTVDSAVHDSEGNVIADYVKTIVVDNQSNYVTVTHGTGNTDTLVINYANKAWKDTYDNVIGNTYIRRLACEQDTQTGHYMIVAYNGELSELFRFEVLAYSAQTDINGRDITSYVGAVEVDDNDDTNLLVIDGDDTIINTINGTVTVTPTGTVSGTAVSITDPTITNTVTGTLPSATYTASTYTLTFDPGTLPTVTSTASGTAATVTDPTFTGDAETEYINFSEV